MWSKGATKDIPVTQEMPKVLRVLWHEQGTKTNTFHTVLHSFTQILPWLPTFLWAASISAPRLSESALPTCPAALILSFLFSHMTAFLYPPLSRLVFTSEPLFLLVHMSGKPFSQKEKKTFFHLSLSTLSSWSPTVSILLYSASPTSQLWDR